MEKGNFEKSWRDAFDGAEATPSHSVWTNVELELERAAGGKMKQRLLFYKLLAAASLVFAMGVGGVYYVSYQNDQHQIVGGLKDDTVPALREEVVKIPKEEASEKAINSTSEAKVSEQSISAATMQRAVGSDDQTSRANTITKALSFPPGLNSNGTIISNPENDFYNTITDRFVTRPLPALVNTSKPTLIINNTHSEPDPGMVLLAKLNDEEKKYAAMDKRKSTENVWTSIGIGAGSFNPNTTTSVSQNISTGSSNQNPSVNNGSSAGSSYSLGLQFGGRVINRFVLLGGISYLTQNASYTSTVVSMESSARTASLNDFSNTQTYSVANTPYGVNSNLQFISLPVQAGYLIVDKDFSIQLNGGISTDFFMVNTLTPEVSGINKISQSAGDDSPYRTVNFSGLAGTEFSYKFSDRYRIAVNPGMRYALNSIYKSDANAEVAPITFDVALRFRYIFR